MNLNEYNEEHTEDANDVEFDEMLDAIWSEIVKRKDVATIIMKNFDDIDIDISAEEITQFTDTLSHSELMSLLDGDEETLKRVVERYKSEKDWRKKFWADSNPWTHQGFNETTSSNEK